MFRFPKPNFICKQYNKYRLPSFKSDIYLIEWLPNVKTECHGHNQKNCDFFILKGPLFEKRYLKKNSSEKNNSEKHNSEKNNSEKNNSEIFVYNRFDRGFINDSIGNHQMINFSRYKKWSIHRYS